jgi:hypothetical protein
MKANLKECTMFSALILIDKNALNWLIILNLRLGTSNQQKKYINEAHSRGHSTRRTTSSNFNI